MKKIVLSAAAVFAMSTFAIAGGDIAPSQEPMVDVPAVTESMGVSGLYLGLGYGSLSGEEDYSFNDGYGEVTVSEETREFDQLLFVGGFKFMDYVGVEGRYWMGMNDLTDDFGYLGDLVETDSEIDAWGIYVKPMYPVTPEFNVYALLGYATTTLDEEIHAGNIIVSESTDLDGLSWGLGVAYTFGGNISIFADYVSLYDDTIDYDFGDARSEFTIDTINVGVAYSF